MKKKILITIIILLCALIAVEIAATASSRNVGVGDEDSEFTPDMLTETTAETASLPTETPTPTPIPEPEPDTTAPFFMNINRDAWVAVGNEFNINDFVSYIDNIDSDVELDISGYVDTSVTGTYHLDLTITDDEGNSCSVEVVPQLSRSMSSTVRPSPNNPRTAFAAICTFVCVTCPFLSKA